MKNLIARVAIIFAIIYSLFSHVAYAAETISDGDRYSGKQTVSSNNKSFEASYSVKFIETVSSLPPFGVAFDVVGVITIKDLKSKKSVDLAVQATYDPDTKLMEGKASPSNGKKPLALDGVFSPNAGRVSLLLNFKKTRLSIKGKRDSILPIAGTWDFTNDPAGDMVIVRKGFTNKFTGRYSGTGVHSTLRGTLIGTVVLVDGVYGWTGVFTIKEDPNVKVAGTFNCIIQDNIQPVMGCQYAGGSSASFILSRR